MSVYLLYINNEQEYINKYYYCPADVKKGKVKTEDFVFIRTKINNTKVKISDLWKVDTIDAANHKYTFSVVADNLDIEPDEFGRKKIFMVTKQLMVYIAQNPDPSDHFPELELLNQNTLDLNDNSAVRSYFAAGQNRREILIVNDFSDPSTNEDIRLIRHSDDTFELEESAFISQNLWNQFNGNGYLNCLAESSAGRKIGHAKGKVFTDLQSGKKKIHSVYGFYSVFCTNKGAYLSKNVSSALSKGEDIVATYISKAISDNRKQIVFTGAPGTSKTYSVRKYVKETTGWDENRYKFVQFHPSYDYTDFVEGIRPVVLAGKSDTSFVKLDGAFKVFCRKIVEENLAQISGFEKKKPEDKYKFIEDVVRSNKEDKGEDSEKPEKARDTIHKINSSEKKYFFIIDEINRADLSKVFGELMFGLEESYRGIENRFDTQYKNIPTYTIKNDQAVPMEFDCFKNGFFIPQNLYIIGTMNDIDKSVEAFDFALRRRFEWKDIKADDVMLYVLESMKKEGEIGPVDTAALADKAKNLNKVISEEGKKFGLSDAFHIGPAYYKGVQDLKNSLTYIFESNITSILKEYTRGRNNIDFIEGCRGALLR